MTERPIALSRREISQASGTVLNTAASLTPILVEEHPEIAALFRAKHSRRVIAQIVTPDLADTLPSATRVAIGNVLDELVPPEERRQITREKRADVLRQHRKDMGEEAFKEHQKEAGRARKGKVDNTPTILARGITPWTDTERMFTVFLSTQPDYQYPVGPHKGLVDRKKVAVALNEVFHGGNQTRDIDSIRGFLDAWRKQQRENSK